MPMPADAAAALKAAVDILAVGRVVRAEARKIAGSQGVTFVLAEGDQCFYEDEDAIAPLWKGQRFSRDHCVSGWSMIHGETVVIPDIALDVRVPAEAYAPTFVKSMVMVPIGVPPVAAIGAYWSRVGTPPASAVAALERFAPEVAAALHRVGRAGAPWAPNFG